MRLREITHKYTVELEGKPISRHLDYRKKWPRENFRLPNIYRSQTRQGYFKKPYLNNKDLRFIYIILRCNNSLTSSNIIAKILFQRVGQLIGFAFTIYRYYKVIVIAYNYT